jgi:hypothetical protein
MTHETKKFAMQPGHAGHTISFGATRTGMSATSFHACDIPPGCRYAVYWLFEAGRNLCIETELGGFTATDDAGFAAQRYTPQLFWSGDRLMLDISPRHVLFAIQSGLYAVSHRTDADRLHLYRHVRMNMPLPALRHRTGDLPFNFIRGFCGPEGALYA